MVTGCNKGLHGLQEITDGYRAFNRLQVLGTCRGYMGL